MGVKSCSSLCWCQMKTARMEECEQPVSQKHKNKKKVLDWNAILELLIEIPKQLEMSHDKQLRGCFTYWTEFMF